MNNNNNNSYEDNEYRNIFSRFLPDSIIDYIIEYCMTYKKIFNNILKRDIIIKSPRTFYMNNWTGPELVCASIVDSVSSCTICDISQSTLHLYGKYRNWNRRGHIVDFWPEYVEHFLKIVFRINAHDVFIYMIRIKSSTHINPASLMPPSLQYISYRNHLHNIADDSTYSKIICEIMSKHVIMI